MFVAAGRIIGRFRFVLHDARRVTSFDQVDGFADRFDAKRENLVEIERPGRVIWLDLHLFLQKYRARIDAFVDPKKCKAGYAFAFDQSPIECIGAAIFR